MNLKQLYHILKIRWILRGYTDEERISIITKAHMDVVVKDYIKSACIHGKVTK